MSNNNSGKEQIANSSPEAQRMRIDALDKADKPVNVDVLLLWDTVSHCNEPENHEKMLEDLKDKTGLLSVEKEKQKAAEKEWTEGSYRVKFNGQIFPDRHPSWPEAFQLHVEQSQNYFYVLQSKESKPEDDENIYDTTFATDDPFTRMGTFGYRYKCGTLAKDKDGNLIGKENDQVEFNYAEHMMMGEMLTLQWSKTEQSKGTRILTLPNGVKLSYGEINGLAGDYFGGEHPISDGKDFDQQCKYFIDAFNTLGGSNKALGEVPALRKNHQEEVDAIAKAVKEGKSTFQVYKELNKPSGIPGVSEADAKDELVTLAGDGPSYLRLSLMNFDHFGADAVTAYNAGHYLALKKANEGKLEEAYAMNAFADHFLGDSFAAGHVRTPRRILHSSSTALGAAWAAISGMVQYGLAGHLKFYEGAMKVIVPDLCAMLMHGEDNFRGLWVKNRDKRNEDPYLVLGDKQLFESGNIQSREIMRQGMQASVDEVYEAYDAFKKSGHSGNVKKPEEGYRAWQFTPAEVLKEKNHSPLFIKDESWPIMPWNWAIKVRTPFTDIHSQKYENVGTSPDLIDLYNKISSSDMFKQY